ncbi:MAG: 4-hydroxy-tetrahydrodipicolinate reductase [Deltaproteobacteria bacterium]|nr:4-hydroxy-tetrahydrodipicolinate reductase [Deltaproteobacteria bacterium]
MTCQIAIHGALGRMGRAVLSLVLDDERARLVSAIEKEGCAQRGQDIGTLIGRSEKAGVVVTDSLEQALTNAEVVIDFTQPQSTRALASACASRGIPVVIGTTGLDAACERAIDELAAVAPVVIAPNFSVGVHVLLHLAARATELLGPDFDIEIVEMHHRKKVDAPSGTALRLLESVANARGVDPKKNSVFGRNGEVGARTDKQIGVLALRGGDVVGEHTLILAGPGERLEITHRAHSREIFARGVIRAAYWVVGKKPGRYSMADVLDLNR